jgi:hypothetical protein
MNQHTTFPTIGKVTSRTTAPTRTGSLRRLGTRIAECVRASADYYAAAATYEQLSRLSDAELNRRGLSRANLGRDVCAAFDRAETVR